MRASPSAADDAAAAARDVAEAMHRSGLTVAVAESLTGGRLAAYLGAAPDSATWFRGGVVAYADEVKYDVLGVRAGRVISADCACVMARGVANLLKADLAVAVTGVGGPDPQEGQEPGTVYVGFFADGSGRAEQHRFDGDPDDILDATVAHALRLLLAYAR